jgi:hypothetical protein
MRLFLIMILFVCGSVFSEVTHSGLTGTNVHTPYRWLFADSAARIAQAVTAADTMKLAYQRSDSSSWLLVATTGTKWRKTSIGGPIFGTTGAFSGALTGTTLNTGNGANELYAMDQNVRTVDSINGLVFRSTRVRTDSITTNGTDYIKYSTGTFPCTLKTSDVTVQQVDNAYYTKIGNVLTIFMKEMIGISNSVDLKVYCSLPFAPKNNIASGSVRGYSGGTPISLTYEWTIGAPTYIEFKKYDNSTFATSGIKGIGQCPIVYITQ